MYIVTYTYKDQKFHETILSLLRIIHTVSLFSLFKNKMLVATHYIDFLIQLFKNTDLTDLSFPCPGEFFFFSVCCYYYLIICIYNDTGFFFLVNIFLTKIIF